MDQPALTAVPEVDEDKLAAEHFEQTIDTCTCPHCGGGLVAEPVGADLRTKDYQCTSCGAGLNEDELVRP